MACGGLYLSVFNYWDWHVFDQFWEIKVLGAAYLGYLVYRYFSQPKNGAKVAQKPKQQRRFFGLSNFWSVVIQIEMMDIIFSIDSVLASLAISDNPVIVLIGGMIGIACMRALPRSLCA